MAWMVSVAVTLMEPVYTVEAVVGVAS